MFINDFPSQIYLISIPHSLFMIFPLPDYKYYLSTYIKRSALS